MKVPELVATPPGVMIVILLVIAAVGTVAVTCVAELTTNVAVTSPNVTFVVCVNPVPLNCAAGWAEARNGRYDFEDLVAC